MDLSVRIGSLELKNPLIAASGCFGYGVEYADVVDLAALGAIVSKGLFLAAREGHPAPRIVETPSGMLNAIGLQGIGAQRFINEKMPELRRRGATVIVNVCGTTIDEYVEVSRMLADTAGVGAIELNISCPNIKEGGIQFGCSLNGTYDVVNAVRKVTALPVIPKLTPNVTDVASFARAAADAGDVLEFMIAGADAVQVGTANYVDPFIWPKLLDGISEYLQRHNVARIADLVGTVEAGP